MKKKKCVICGYGIYYEKLNSLGQKILEEINGNLSDGQNTGGIKKI